jgi:hypothetical protein
MRLRINGAYLVRFDDKILHGFDFKLVLRYLAVRLTPRGYSQIFLKEKKEKKKAAFLVEGFQKATF